MAKRARRAGAAPMRTRRALVLLLAFCLALCLWPASAGAYRWSRGELTVQIDSLLSLGFSMRTEEPDCRQIATINGGCNRFADPASSTFLEAEGALLNQDDGNLNWDQWDVFSVLAKGTHDIQADWRSYGAFVRFTWFGDAIQADADASERTPLSHEARFRNSNWTGGVVGAHVLLLDAYLDGGWDVGDRYFSVRVGNQVINWGESLFQQGGINAINTLDVTKIRLPGSELKEALLPAPIVKLGGDLIPNLGFEVYYQFGWRRFELDPAGSFFSTSDLVGRGAQGQFNPLPPPLGYCGDPGTADEEQERAGGLFGCVPPFGVDELTRFPLGIPFLGFRDAADQGQFGAALRYYADAIETEISAYYFRIHEKFPVVEFSGTAASLGACTSGPAAPNPACDIGYSVVHPEDVDVVGLSANTLLGGIALGAEISYRWKQPTPVTFDNALCNADNLAACGPGTSNEYAGQRSLVDALGLSPGPIPDGGGRVPGFVETDRLVGVVNALYILSPGTPVFGRVVDWIAANDLTAIVELAVTHYMDLDQCPVRGGARVAKEDCRSYPTPFGVDRVDDTGWGYTIRLSATYDRILGLPITFLPAVSLGHDVSGITPPSEAGFNDEKMALGVTLEFSYLQRWSGILSYSNSFGAGIRNGDTDRDFLGATLTYRF